MSPWLGPGALWPGSGGQGRQRQPGVVKLVMKKQSSRALARHRCSQKPQVSMSCRGNYSAKFSSMRTRLFVCRVHLYVRVGILETIMLLLKRDWKWGSPEPVRSFFIISQPPWLIVKGAWNRASSISFSPFVFKSVHLSALIYFTVSEFFKKPAVA